MAPTDGFHVVVKVLAGNHLPRPDKLLDHVGRTCGCLSSTTTTTTTTTCRRLWVRSPPLWEQSPFKREQRGVRPSAASQSQGVPSRGRVLDPPHPTHPPILLTLTPPLLQRARNNGAEMLVESPAPAVDRGVWMKSSLESNFFFSTK